MILVTDRFDAPNHFEAADLFISILDPSFKEFKLKGPRDKHFIARFDDTEHPGDTEWMKMNREVRGILSWVRSHKATLDTNIVVHCHAGVSRSSAVAWLILIMLGQDPREAFQMLYKARPQIWPNITVLSIGAQTLHLGADFMKLVDDINTEITLNRREYLGYGG